MSTLIIDTGDWIKDPMDGEMRQVESIIDSTIYMVDGGVVGLDELDHDDIYLEGEEDPDWLLCLEGEEDPDWLL